MIFEFILNIRFVFFISQHVSVSKGLLHGCNKVMLKEFFKSVGELESFENGQKSPYYIRVFMYCTMYVCVLYYVRVCTYNVGLCILQYASVNCTMYVFVLYNVRVCTVKCTWACTVQCLCVYCTMLVCVQYS